MRLVPAVVVGTGVVLAAVIVPAGGAYGEAPSQQGWWTQTNPGSVGGSPTPPPPPDVPSDGLLIEGGVSSASGPSDSGPTAYAAVVYQVPLGDKAATLTLKLAPQPAASTPSTTLELCPLANPAFNPEQGGPSSDAPAFDCTHNVTVGESSSGNTYTFNNVSWLVSNGVLATAILPTAITDRIVLNKPDVDSLSLDVLATPGPSGGVTTGPSSRSTTTNVATNGGSVGSATSAEPPAVSVSSQSAPSRVGAVAPSISSVPTLGSLPGPGNTSASSVDQTSTPSNGRGEAKALDATLLSVAGIVACLLWGWAGRAGVRRASTRRLQDSVVG
jgi:hypothetical protein